MYDINSIDELIERLGGPTVIGEKFGISQEAVSNWSVRGNIGGSRHVQLLAMTRRKGLSVNPIVFGLNEKDVEGLFQSETEKAPARPKRKAEARVA